MVETFSRNIAGRTLSLEVGRFAEQASGAVLVRYGDTIVLVSVCTAQPREGVDFFPLTVDYEERHYAVGKIPGSFFRREGRPPENAILSSRLTDRCLRPLFPKGFRNEVQVIATVLSADQENLPEVLSIVGASAALCISEIPFEGPVGAVRIGYVNDELTVNPTYAEIQTGRLDLVVAGTSEAVVMVEAGAKEVPEEIVLEAMRRGQEVNQELIDLQREMVRKLGKPKASYTPLPSPTPELEAQLAGLVKSRVEDLFVQGAARGERNVALDALESEAVEKLGEAHEKSAIKEAFEKLVKSVMRTRVLKHGKRADGRGPEEIRPISIEVGVLPRTHGSGVFRRGQTQVLTIATLGSMSMIQNLDTLTPEASKRYMHHYNFPPYSVGEVRRVGNPGRREIGHGALAERALEPVLPSEEEFPYAIRLVSEVLSSNGSTSMASVCGSSLALMDAGVPIKAPVAGVAMGLIMDEATREYAVLTDIQGVEDFQGDMDFKVAGTAEGISALQLDVKVKGIDFTVISKTLSQAKRGRMFILDKMREAIPLPRTALSPYAPRMLKLNIPVDKIGALIGPGGRTIRAMTAEYKVTIDVESDGTVIVGSSSQESAQLAHRAIMGLVKDPEVGEIYTGKVTRIMGFGAFVEILPGKEGLVHISELAERRVERVEDEVKVGDEVTVMITEVDRMGRLNLSRRAVYAEGAPREGGEQAPVPPRPEGGPPFGGGDRDRRPDDGQGQRPMSGPPRRDGPDFRRGPGQQGRGPGDRGPGGPRFGGPGRDRGPRP
ncbi:MAG: polyribonucleotide nucleotidyltransferase [Chloroflexi bacterium]|nr:polyribonucleotide nucleotidyltransferase [Chloroflexota bacterium]